MSSTSTSRLTDDIRHPLTIKNGTATFGIGLVGLLGANLVPLMLIALSARGVDAIASGAILTAGLMTTALTCIITARWSNGHARRRIAMAGLILTAAGFGTAALAPITEVLAFGVVLGGLGAGAAASASGAALAALRNSVRVSGLNGTVNRAVVAALLFIIPLVGLNTFTVFGVVAGFALALLPIAHMLPDTPAREGQVTSLPTASAALETKGSTAAGILLLICFGLWGLSEDAVWAVVGTIGRMNVGLNEAELGAILGIATLAGLTAPVVISIVGNRFGRALPLGVAVVGTLLLKATLGLTDTPALFTAQIVIWSVLYTAGFMYIVATAAALNASGRWSSPIIGAYLVGSAIAPLYATTVLETLDILAFGLTLAGLSAIVLVPLLVIARKSSRVEPAISTPHDEQDTKEISK